MISHKHKFIFIHIPRSAGNSIQTALGPYADDKITDAGNEDICIDNVDYRDIFKHTSLDVYSKYYNLDDYLIFTSIRNPWDRMLSLCFFYSGKFDKVHFKRYLRSARTTHDYMTVNGKVYLDNIIRYEQIEYDFNKITKKLGLPDITIPHMNSRKHDSYKEYYDEETIELVYSKFKIDIDRFGYQFDQDTNYTI